MRQLTSCISCQIHYRRFVGQSPLFQIKLPNQNSLAHPISGRAPVAKVPGDGTSQAPVIDLQAAV